MESLAERLKKLRDQNQYSVKYICEKISVPETTYREWEIGRQIKGHSAYIKIAELYGISVHELLTGQRSQNQDLKNQIDKVESELNNLKTMINTLS